MKKKIKINGRQVTYIYKMKIVKIKIYIVHYALLKFKKKISNRKWYLVVIDH